MLHVLVLHLTLVITATFTPWFMLQVDNHPDTEEPVRTTPLIRLFYDVQLIEIGYTVETEELLVNWIVRF